MSSEGRGIPEAYGTYVFCVTRATLAELPPVAGLEAEIALERVDAGALTSVVCTVELDAWTGPESDRRLSDLEWLGPRALRHELVIERVMASAPVLPLRFGCLFSSRARVVAWLERHADAITRFLDAIEGYEEWAVRAWVDLERCSAALAASDPRARSLPSGAGARYLQQKLLKRDATKRARAWVRDAERDATALVGERALLHRALPLSNKQLSGREDEPAFHTAFMIRPGELGALRERVEQLASTWSDHGVSVEFTGPWPPYSFCPPLGHARGEGVGGDDRDRGA